MPVCWPAGAGINDRNNGFKRKLWPLIGTSVGIPSCQYKTGALFLVNCYVDFIRGTPLRYRYFYLFRFAGKLLGTARDPLFCSSNFSLFPSIIVVLILRKFSVPVSNHSDKGQMEAGRSLGMSWAQTHVMLLCRSL